jgi:hypothetical protein
MIPGATIRWRGTATSSSRRNRITGEAETYPMTIYEDGRASCGCPAFLLKDAGNKKLAENEKNRYRCSHLAKQFAVLGGAPVPPPAPKTAKAAKPKPVEPAEIDPDILDFTPIARR